MPFELNGINLAYECTVHNGIILATQFYNENTFSLNAITTNIVIFFIHISAMLLVAQIIILKSHLKYISFKKKALFLGKSCIIIRSKNFVKVDVNVAMNIFFINTRFLSTIGMT